MDLYVDILPHHRNSECPAYSASTFEIRGLIYFQNCKSNTHILDSLLIGLAISTYACMPTLSEGQCREKGGQAPSNLSRWDWRLPLGSIPSWRDHRCYWVPPLGAMQALLLCRSASTYSPNERFQFHTLNDAKLKTSTLYVPNLRAPVSRP